MLQNYCVLLAMGSLCAIPGLGNIVNVTIGGNAIGSGDVVARCFTSPSCADQEFLSFNGTNNNSDNFTASGSVTAADRVTLSGSVQQNTTVSSDSFSVDMESLTTLDAIGAEWGARVDIQNSYSLTFTLTTESVMHLSEPSNVGNSQQQEFCFFEGPDSNPKIPLPCFDGGSFDQSITLGPGTYFVSLSDELAAGSFQCCGQPTHDVIMDHMVLDAQFTAVPEPEWGGAVIPVVLLAVVLLSKSRGAALRDCSARLAGLFSPVGQAPFSCRGSWRKHA